MSEVFTGSPRQMAMINGEAKTASPNPKDLFGNKKVPLSLLPPIAQIEGSMAMEDGGYKYGPYNWREHPVQARIYIEAVKRHLLAWEDGQEVSSDATVHHLGHIIACCGILLDAQMSGNMIDDRKKTGKIAAILDERSKLIEKKQAERKIKAALNVDANVPDVRTIPVQGSPKDSAEVPVRLDMGQLFKDKALAELKKDYERFAVDIRTSRFDSSVEEPTRPRKVPNGF